ncbi:hypothetical protein Fcan01_02663 [Folsomia candida]|uniref:Uncharacterized protein n=1 Tax=Folsomia candida TaxID=158441 RepID=A0A226F3L7_FOLCA|nr:hypothetical protein Fcan01_02663 [Folsomia candida]
MVYIFLAVLWICICTLSYGVSILRWGKATRVAPGLGSSQAKGATANGTIITTTTTSKTTRHRKLGCVPSLFSNFNQDQNQDVTFVCKPESNEKSKSAMAISCTHRSSDESG